MDEQKKDQEEIEEVDSSDLDRRRELLAMVIGDLNNEFVATRVKGGEPEEDAQTNASLDTTYTLIEEAAHLLVHSTEFDTPETFVTILEGMLKEAIDGHRAHITLMKESPKSLDKNLS